MWYVYRAGRIGALCIRHVRLDFQYNCDVTILMFNHTGCRIDKWYITMTSHTRQRISTHWQLYRLLNISFRQTWKKHQAELLWGESTGDGITAHWTTNAPNQWSLATGNHRWPAVSSHTGPLMSSITEWQITLHYSNIIWVSWVSHSLVSLPFVQQLVCTRMKEDITHPLQLRGGSTGNKWRHHKPDQQCGNL